jgi:hypothetical protein
LEEKAGALLLIDGELIFVSCGRRAFQLTNINSPLINNKAPVLFSNLQIAFHPHGALPLPCRFVLNYR